MLDEFYKLGALQALADRRVVKAASIGSLIQQAVGAAPGVAQTLAKKKVTGAIKSELRDAVGFKPPEWRAHGMMEIPGLAGAKLEAVLPKTIQGYLPRTLETALKEVPEELEPVVTPTKPEKPEEMKPDEG